MILRSQLHNVHFRVINYPKSDVLSTFFQLSEEKRIISHVPHGHLKAMNSTGMFLAAIWLENSALVSTSRGNLVHEKLLEVGTREIKVIINLIIFEFRLHRGI